MCKVIDLRTNKNFCFKLWISKNSLGVLVCHELPTESGYKGTASKIAEWLRRGIFIEKRGSIKATFQGICYTIWNTVHDSGQFCWWKMNTALWVENGWQEGEIGLYAKRREGTIHTTQDIQHSKKVKMCALFSERGRAKYILYALKRIALIKYHF